MPDPEPPRKFPFPFSLIVGQQRLKRALEIAYIVPRIGGVLLSGHRGTGKSTAVRAFAQMIYDDLPITLPINATDDRVIAGWDIHSLMRGEPQVTDGLIMQANDKILYVDEVNLLDDHLVNTILDVSSTGILVVQREGIDREESVKFTLIGTMNPDEGNLRPQLLDRFGLFVNVVGETERDPRAEILRTILKFDSEVYHETHGKTSDYLAQARRKDLDHKRKLDEARSRLHNVSVPDEIIQMCVEAARKLGAEGHRGDYVMALAARACAALEGKHDKRGHMVVTADHVREVAPLALYHRRSTPSTPPGEKPPAWSDDDDKRLQEAIDDAATA